MMLYVYCPIVILSCMIMSAAHNGAATDRSCADAYDLGPSTPFHKMVHSGNVVGVVSILTASPELVNATDDNSCVSAIHWAVLSEKPEMVALLLYYGADPHIIGPHGLSPFKICEISLIAMQGVGIDCSSSETLFMQNMECIYDILRKGMRERENGKLHVETIMRKTKEQQRTHTPIPQATATPEEGR